MSVPKRIQQALTDRVVPSEGDAHGPIVRGDVRQVDPVVTGSGDRRLALVLRIDSEREAAEIMLVHPYEEMATSADVIVAPASTSLAYTIVAETDIRGVVWLTQLGRSAGRLLEDALQQVGLVAANDPGAAGPGLRGQRLAGPLDARWDFKLSEVEQIQELAGDCTAHLLEDASPWRLDAGMFWLEALNSVPGHLGIMEDLLDAISKKKVFFDYEDLQILEQQGVLDLDQWTAVFGSVGLEYYNAYLLPLIDEALSRGPADGEVHLASPEEFTHPRRLPSAGSVNVRPGARLITAAHLWLEEIQQEQELQVQTEPGTLVSMVAVVAGGSA